MTTIGADRSLPRYSLFVVLLLSVGSGCAALIYEPGLVSSSSNCSSGRRRSLWASCLGRSWEGMYLGSAPSPVPGFGAPTSALYLRRPRAWHWDLRHPAACRAAGCWPRLRKLGRSRCERIRLARCSRSFLPAASHDGHGGHTTGGQRDGSKRTLPRGLSGLVEFYAGNTAGAALGSLVAGFYLLRVYDVATATFVAAGLNGLMALAGWGLAAIIPCPSPRGLPAASKVRPTATTRVVYVVIAISGFSALAGEVVWTRILALLFGATVYTFSIILAVFLIGIGLGSAIGALVARHTGQPKRMLGWCQLWLVAAIAWTAYMLSNALPYWPIITSASPNIRYTFEINFACALLALLPGPMLWGAASRSRLPLRPVLRSAIQADWWEASTRPIPSAPSPALWQRASFSSRRSDRSTCSRP